LRRTTGASSTEELLPVPSTVDAPAQGAPSDGLRVETASGAFTDATSTAAGVIDSILEEDGGVGDLITTVVQVGNGEGDEEQGRAEHRLIQEHARAAERCQNKFHGA